MSSALISSSMAYNPIAASHLPITISASCSGEVSSSSMVIERFSSENRRIAIIGIRNSPITLVFISSGRITISLTSIGKDRPIICDCRLISTK